MKVKEFWGSFIGLIIGYAMAKVYLIWAMLYREIGLGMAGIQSWEPKKVWQLATENPGIFTLVVSIIFTIIGYAFVENLQKTPE